MQIISQIRNYIKKRFHLSPQQVNPELAYDLWASAYDNQPDNLMLVLDEALFPSLINEIVFKGKIMVDVGCGTGRHWQKMIDREPKKMIGYDVSEGMLAELKKKFAGAQSHKLKGIHLPELNDESCDIVISTLAIAHIQNVEEALTEWNRVLKPGGEILITDYHPEALLKGGNRSFKHNGKIIEVKNYIHTIEDVKKIARQLHWNMLRLIEKKIDSSMLPYYEKQNALEVYERFKGVPIIYGVHLKKMNADL